MIPKVAIVNLLMHSKIGKKGIKSGQQKTLSEAISYCHSDFQGSSNQRGMAWCEPTRGHHSAYLGSNLAADRHGGSVQVRTPQHLSVLIVVCHWSFFIPFDSWQIYLPTECLWTVELNCVYTVFQNLGSFVLWRTTKIKRCTIVFPFEGKKTFHASLFLFFSMWSNFLCVVIICIYAHLGMW